MRQSIEFIMRLRRPTLLVLLAVLIAIYPLEVHAASVSDRQAAGRDTPWFELGDFGQPCTAANASGTADGVDGFLRALAKQESGGDPKAQNPGSTASGKYQYIDSTWQSRKDIYPPSGNFSRASDAPESIQDAVAYIEYSKKFADFQNSIFKLAVSHFYPLALTDPSYMDKQIGTNTITPREYGEAMVGKVRAGEGSDIPLKYTSAPKINEYITVSESPVDEQNTASCDAAASAQTGLGLAATTLSYAWPNYKEGYTTKKPAYKAAVARAKSKGLYTGDTCLGGGVDCGAFVTILLRDSGFEPDYNYSGRGGNTDTQLAWARANWQRLGRGNTIDTGDLRPGDVAFVVYSETNAHHTFVFVGDIPGFNSDVASSSQCKRAPMAGAESKTAADVVWYRQKP